MRRQRAQQGEPVRKHGLSSSSHRWASPVTRMGVQEITLVTQASVEWLDRLCPERSQQNPPNAGWRLQSGDLDCYSEIAKFLRLALFLFTFTRRERASSYEEIKA